MRALFAPALLLLALPAYAAESEARIGAAAPALSISRTFKGEAVTSFRPGKVYVVEFWATWCGPCKVSIPHLTQLAKKHTDVSFVGVSVWESGRIVKDTDHAKIEAFVKGMGDKMGYTVAADTPEGGMDKAWMEAYGQDGIPAAFIVDQQGRVAYVDHPMSSRFETAIEQVKAGTWDIAKAREAMDAEMAGKKAARESQKAFASALASVLPEIKSSALAGDYDAAESAFAKVAAANPLKTPEGGSVVMKPYQRILGLLAADEAAYHRYAWRMARAKDADANMLNSVAWNICTSSKLKNPDYAVAAIVATRACELTSYNDPQVLDTLGLALFKSGRKDRAIAIQTKAVALAEDPATKAELQGRLDEFKKG